MFFRFFLPIMWIVFFGSVVSAMILHPGFKNAVNEIFPGLVYIFSFLYLATIGAFYLTVMKLKRVECDELFVYATNYFKTARYPYHQIERIEEQSFFGIPIIDIQIKEKGTFGKRFFFLGRNSTINQLHNKFEELSEFE